MAKTLTHFDRKGAARMVDVGDKVVTHRVARASGDIRMRAATLQRVLSGDAKKGDVIGVARIAAIQAAKRTSDLIPLCHPLALTKVSVEFSVNRKTRTVTCLATVETVGRTGVEMEALTAATAGLLTIYDMCKAMDRGMCLSKIRLLEKSGGKSGHWIASTADR